MVHPVKLPTVKTGGLYLIRIFVILAALVWQVGCTNDNAPVPRRPEQVGHPPRNPGGDLDRGISLSDSIQIPLRKAHPH